MSTFQTKIYENISRSIQYLAFGYIRAIQPLFPINNSYYNIPVDIVYICALYCNTDSWGLKNDEII